MNAAANLPDDVDALKAIILAQQEQNMRLEALIAAFRQALPRHTFHLHLKETEWRYNHRASDKPKLLLRYLRENPLS